VLLAASKCLMFLFAFFRGQRFPDIAARCPYHDDGGYDLGERTHLLPV
jgi:hypothetical protein